MADELIIQRDLVSQLDRIKQKDWERVANNLGLIYSKSRGKGSHALILDPATPDQSNIKAVIVTIPKKLFKQSNIQIFKSLRRFGSEEEKIWEALRIK